MFGLNLYKDEIIIEKNIETVLKDFSILFGHNKDNLNLFFGKIDNNEFIMRPHPTIPKKINRFCEPILCGLILKEIQNETKITINVILEIIDVITYIIFSICFLFLLVMSNLYIEETLYKILFSIGSLFFPVGNIIYINYTKNIMIEDIQLYKNGNYNKYL